MKKLEEFVKNVIIAGVGGLIAGWSILASFTLTNNFYQIIITSGILFILLIIVFYFVMRLVSPKK